MRVTLMPLEKKIKILKVFDAEDNELAIAEAGDNVKVKKKLKKRFL